MYLSTYNNPRVQLLTTQKQLRGSTVNLAQLQIPGAGSLQVPSTQLLSRSQGNLLQLPGSGSQPPAQGLSPQDRYKSRSLNLLESESTIYQVPRASLGAPSIQVDAGPGGRSRSLTVDSGGSAASSEDSEFSFSDEASTSGSDSLNLSRSSMDEELRRSRTPPPPAPTRDLLSPDSGLGMGGRLTHSRSNPNLAKGPNTPKVPPRPQAQDILKRCTTVTRKNATRNQLAPMAQSIQIQ